MDNQDAQDVTSEPVAKPWYLSKAVIASLAGILMSVAPKILLLLGVNLPLTQEQANAVVTFIIPQVVALYGRLTATHVLTSTAAKAVELNQSAV